MLFTHRPSRLIILFLHFCLVSCLSGTPIYWPTANPAFQKNLGIENYIQATASGKIVSGLFGCVRNDGHKFHEGLDLKATTYGKNKESIDPVFSVMKGIVAYVNIRDKKSSYGRYVIIEHTDESPSIFSLYAHLKSVNSKIKTGASVKSGQVIGIMGRSSSVYDIPKNQTHLHFELGLRLSDNFQSWYDQRKFKSKNDHNIWNGMNLVGFDPLEYYKSHRTGKINSIHEYLSQLKPACTIKIISNKTPDFIHRYPSLSTEKFDKKGIKGWDIKFSWYGLPYSWTPLYNLKEDDKQAILSYDNTLLPLASKRSILSKKGDAVIIGSILNNYLKLLFQ